MTVSEYSDASRDDQADTIGMNLNAIHNYYTSNQLNDQAQCMMDLYKPAVEGGAPVLMHRILDGIDAARNDQKVSNVIITVVEKNCGQPASEEASE
ncbi:hypothetical protein DFP92_1118 [Yoonia sediminilitoris]|uniref:Uncharacterized protein n=2 Tax=Yoonia sediminilitoris TaxID=1286148 RepID=A0A2T6KAY6_9RHOB|nr:hypothetical protein C8N45_1119 [Yoonia sediminilitoris]RCW92859.1 hypothetical protein DFP92_1118 [Yoonia sediminilitoris]